LPQKIALAGVQQYPCEVKYITYNKLQ